MHASALKMIWASLKIGFLLHMEATVRFILIFTVLGRGFGMLMVAHVGVGGSKMDQNMLT